MLSPLLYSNPRNKVVLSQLGDLKAGQSALLVQFDLDAGSYSASSHRTGLTPTPVDFTPTWTWNTKEVFVYVVATFETKDKVRH